MRDHTKSRRGCLQCRQRRVKCDETLPQCQRCARRHERCSYLDDFGSSAPSTPSVITTPAHDQAPSIPVSLLTHDDGISLPTVESASSSGPVPWNSYLVDLELTHFYLVHTCQTLWGRSEGYIIHRDMVFHEAMKQPALLNGVLTTAALHQISTDPVRHAEYIPIALHKQRQALEGLRILLQSLNIESCRAIFTLSILVSIWALASRRLPEELSILSTIDPTAGQEPAEPRAATGSSSSGAGGSTTTSSDLDLFLQLIRRIRAVQAIALESRSWLIESDFSALIRTPSPDQLPELPASIARALDTLDHHLHALAPSIARMMAQLDARHGLPYLFRVSRSPDWLELLLGWPMTLPGEFVEALQNRHHGALTLLAYWAACLYALDGRWWAKGWAEALIAEADGIVEGVWSSLLEWPKLYLSVL